MQSYEGHCEHPHKSNGVQDWAFGENGCLCECVCVLGGGGQFT